MKRISLLILIILGVLAWSSIALAGFGISPPYVKSDKLIPGSHYEQRIVLLRSSAEDDLQAVININAPEITSWISIDKGENFDLPKGELQVPMVVRVDPPKDAGLGNYKGYINIRITPKNAEKGSGVSIALGARVDIDLTLTNETNPDFLVKTVNIPSFEMPSKLWTLPPFAWFFYNVKVQMKIENVGNVKVAPTKVVLDIYDITEKNLMTSKTDKKVEKIEPFNTATINASFPIRLQPGEYWGKVKVYKENQIVRNDKIIFTIAKPGTMPGGRLHLGPWPWLMLAGIILLVLALLYLLYKIRAWRILKYPTLLILWPLKLIIQKTKKISANLKVKFWQWVHKKSAKYQNYEKDDGK